MPARIEEVVLNSSVGARLNLLEMLNSRIGLGRKVLSVWIVPGALRIAS
jgi:hypothetical protein